MQFGNNCTAIGVIIIEHFGSSHAITMPIACVIIHTLHLTPCNYHFLSLYYCEQNELSGLFNGTDFL